MDWLAKLFTTPSAASAVLVLSLVAALGLALGSIKIRGVSLGIGGVMFAGLACGSYGLAVHPDVLEFVREFGLILFVYAVGMQVGPGFLVTLRREGLELNLLAVAMVLLSVGVMLALYYGARMDLSAATGLLCGACTNTPSLAATQQALKDVPGMSADAPKLAAAGYAVAYPLGVLGLILSQVVLRWVFRADLKAEAEAWQREREQMTPVPRVTATDEDGLAVRGFTRVMRTVAPRATAMLFPSSAAPTPQHPQVIPVFVGILLGVLVGSIPVHWPGLPAPLRLGLAGGPLVVAVLLSGLGRVGPLDWRLPPGAVFMLREIGIVLFLACVGLLSSDFFVASLRDGRGMYWLAGGVCITLIPVVLVSFFARKVMKMNFLTLTGFISGSVTDPPALAFASATAGNDAPAVAYATVYPLTMLLRVLSVQLLVLLLA